MLTRYWGLPIRTAARGTVGGWGRTAAFRCLNCSFQVSAPPGCHRSCLDVRKHTWLHPCPLWGRDWTVALSFWDSVSCYERHLASQSHWVSILFTLDSKGTCTSSERHTVTSSIRAQDPTVWNCSPSSCRQKPPMLAFFSGPLVNVWSQILQPALGYHTW